MIRHNWHRASYQAGWERGTYQAPGSTDVYNPPLFVSITDDMISVGKVSISTTFYYRYINTSRGSAVDGFFYREVSIISNATLLDRQ